MNKIVVARYSEKINWILENNLQDRSIIYNKGRSIVSDSSLNIKHVRNIGREAETYISYIIENYENLDDYIIFTQAYPFDHSPDFLSIINYCDKNGYKLFQPLSCQWNKSENIPPTKFIEFDKSEWINNKYKIYFDIVDEDLCSFFYKDIGFFHKLHYFKTLYKLSNTEKILPFLYEKLKINKPYINHSKFNFGAIFGVSKSNILQNDILFYKNLYEFICEDNINASILERLWYLILS